jgi:hypothetical protein
MGAISLGMGTAGDGASSWSMTDNLGFDLWVELQKIRCFPNIWDIPWYSQENGSSCQPQS